MSQLTKKAIVETFVRLLNERPLNKITVKDIVEECGINRNTFYYHFEDIPSLVEEILRTEAEQVIGKNQDTVAWEDAFIDAADFALKNKRAVYHIYNSVSRDVVDRYLNAIAEYVMCRFVEHMSEGIAAHEQDKALIVHFYKAALVGMIVDWLEAGMKYEPEILIRRVGQLFDGNIRISLERSASLDFLQE